MQGFIIFALSSLIVNGVFGDEVVTVEVKEGDYVTLHTNVMIQQSNVIRIRWYSNYILIAQIRVHPREICTDVQCDAGNERFRDRLQLNNETGSLTITNTRTTDSGLYELKISSISNLTEKTFNVNVSKSDLHFVPDPGVSSGRSSGAVAGIIVCVLVVVVAAVGVIFRQSVRDGVRVIYQKTRGQEDQE